MKKLKYFLVFILVVMLIPTKIFAASGVSVNKTTVTVTEGSSISFKLTANNSAGKINISSNNKSIAKLTSSSEFWIENQTKTITIKGVKVGTTSIKIVVDAATFDKDNEKPIKKTITVKVNVVPKKNSDNDLESLKVSPTNISGFNKDKTSYTITVDNSVEEINITAKSEDSKATVSGTGTKKLNLYKNEFNIIVTAENGSKKTYTVIVNRKDKDGNDHKLSSDTKLSLITIKDHEFKFNQNDENFNLDVDSNVENIEITAIPRNAFAKVEIQNVTVLNPGENKIKIIVTAENGDQEEYTLTVFRDDGTPRVSLDELLVTLDTTESDTIILNIRDDNDILTSEMLKKLKENEKKLIINKYIDNVLLYSWILEGKDIAGYKDINTLVEFYSSSDKKINELTNYANYNYIKNYLDTSLFENIELRLYLDNKYNDEKIFAYIYDTNELELEKEDIKYVDNYLEIKNISEGNFVITQLEIKGCVYKTIAIVEFIIIILMSIFIITILLKKIASYKRKTKRA